MVLRAGRDEVLVAGVAVGRDLTVIKPLPKKVCCVMLLLSC